MRRFKDSSPTSEPRAAANAARNAPEPPTNNCHKSLEMADDAAPPELPPREAATPPELPPREAVESLAEDVADLDAAAEDEGYEEEAADAAEELQEAPLTEEEEEARGVAQHLLLNAPPGEFSELLDDIAALTPERALEGGFVNGVARARNAQILETAVTPDGARVVLCREAEVTPTTYKKTRCTRAWKRCTATWPILRSRPCAESCRSRSSR